MFRRILVPLDGSSFAESALPFAAHLARMFEAEIHLLRVNETIAHGQKILPIAPEEEVARYLDAMRRRLESAGVDVRWDMAMGHAHEAIETYTRGFGIDLVALSRHGAGRSAHPSLGSVARRCVGLLTVPLLLVRAAEGAAPPLAGGTAEIRRILVPLDGSELAQQILPQVDGFLRRCDAEIRLIRVVPSHTAFSLRHPTVADSLAADARIYLDSMRAAQSERCMRTADPIVARGEAVTEIVRVAREWEADLIAMSTHGRSGVGRWVYGSVAEGILHASRTPVLLLRAGVGA